MSSNILIYGLSILPIILILFYVYINDRIEKEPVLLLTLLFISGIIACISSYYFQVLIKGFIPFLNKSYYEMNILQIVFKSLITIAFIEEGLKWTLNYIFIRKNKNFNHMYDPIVYSTFVSLGFAALENFIYIKSYFSQGLRIVILRGFISIPCHAVFGILMGYFIGKSKKAKLDNNYKDSKKYLLFSSLIPITMHFIYDLCLVKSNNATFIMFITFIITCYVSVFKIIKSVSNVNKMLE